MAVSCLLTMSKNCNVGRHYQYYSLDQFNLLKRKRREWIETMACHSCPLDAIEMPKKSLLLNETPIHLAKKHHKILQEWKRVQRLKHYLAFLSDSWRCCNIVQHSIIRYYKNMTLKQQRISRTSKLKQFFTTIRKNRHRISSNADWILTEL